MAVALMLTAMQPQSRSQRFLQIAPDTILTFPADGQTGHPDHIAVHRWTVEAVRRARIGTLHMVANTQDWLDDQLPQ
jgi:LmbE family N-acetylglucosaminyl deacetylase